MYRLCESSEHFNCLSFVVMFFFTKMSWVIFSFPQVHLPKDVAVCTAGITIPEWSRLPWNIHDAWTGAFIFTHLDNDSLIMLIYDSMKLSTMLMFHSTIIDFTEVIKIHWCILICVHCIGEDGFKPVPAHVLSQTEASSLEFIKLFH